MSVIVDGTEIAEKIGTPVPLNEAETAKQNGSASSNKPSSSHNTNGTSSNSSLFKPKVSSMDTSENLAGHMTHPISSLTPYQNK